MFNYYSTIAVLSGMGCLLASGVPVQAADRSPALAQSEPGSSCQVEMRQAPVPFVRKSTAASGPPIADVEPTKTPDAAGPAPATVLGSGAAKAAVEADGYKRVVVLGPGPNGTWRVTGRRGDSEVRLTVDQAGSVITE